jgi:hypothetical protein
LDSGGVDCRAKALSAGDDFRRCRGTFRYHSGSGFVDALDAWGVHEVGGALGAILTDVFAKSAINP